MRDEFDSVVADRFKVLDQVPVPDTWSRVLGQVPIPDTWSRVQSTEEVLTMVDLETAVPTEPRQGRPMRVLVAGIVAAAAVVAIVLVASRFGDDATPSDEPSPTVTVTVPPAPPQALFEQPTLGELEPGTYYVDEVDGTATPRILVTIGDGWEHDAGWSIGKGDIQAIMTFSRPDKVFVDSCDPTKGYHAGPMTTLDGLVAALSEQGGWIDVTTPTDISIDGYAGKAFQRKTPTDFSDCIPVPVMFPSWENVSESGQRGWSYYPPGDTESVMVLDVDTTIIILETRVNAGQPAVAHAEIAAVLDSVRIDGG